MEPEVKQKIDDSNSLIIAGVESDTVAEAHIVEEGTTAAKKSFSGKLLLRY